jgi:hypothetical protein
MCILCLLCGIFCSWFLRSFDLRCFLIFKFPCWFFVCMTYLLVRVDIKVTYYYCVVVCLSFYT